mmetsp:Transcript_27086/g.37332  ORF Transcript_27086/g.37332 Transcript_27086/m.37332 type:complete len:118 (+) Transcript_27086:636-989(+)
MANNKEGMHCVEVMTNHKKTMATNANTTANSITSSSITSSSQSSGSNTNARYGATTKKTDIPQSQNATKKGFDYASLPSQQAVSVLAGKDTREKERGSNKGHKPKDTATNPYLFKSK